ncbi:MULTISPECIES: hypothetical protein [unclassified Streptomyces]|uniref:hypothetical protein n=1 Tax=unclassified Streptomyces TaxID=2593676 RepID=UPI002E29C35A|nr:hypothetical protein [Streptomyces sp. NBC_00273]
MTGSLRTRRLLVGTASAGLLAGGSLLGLSGTANAAPAASATVSSTLTGDRDRDRDHRQDRHDRWDHHNRWDRHDRCTWVKGHWESKWHHGTWHEGYRDHHGNWHDGWWGKGHSQHWVPGHWNCHNKW